MSCGSSATGNVQPRLRTRDETVPFALPLTIAAKFTPGYEGRTRWIASSWRSHCLGPGTIRAITSGLVRSWQRFTTPGPRTLHAGVLFPTDLSVALRFRFGGALRGPVASA